MKLYPRCMPYFPDGSKNKDYPKGAAYTSAGFMLPCCWCDNEYQKDFEEMGFFDSDMHISNHESLETIYSSEPFNKFFTSFFFDIDQVPTVCRLKCSDTEQKKDIIATDAS